jgi:hypothetical protein
MKLLQLPMQAHLHLRVLVFILLPTLLWQLGGWLVWMQRITLASYLQSQLRMELLKW